MSDKKNEVPLIKGIINEIKILLKAVIVGIRTSPKSYFKSIITKVFVSREARKRAKNIIIIFSFINFIMFIVIILLLFFYRDSIFSLLSETFRYKLRETLSFNLDRPIQVRAPIVQPVTIPFKQVIRLRVPFKGKIAVPINHTFEVAFDEPLEIHLDHIFPIKEKIHIETVFPLNTKTKVTVLGVSLNIPVKADVPVNLDVPIQHDFHFNEIISFMPKKPIRVPIGRIFEIPIDTILDLKVPLDLKVEIPLNLEFETAATLLEEIPIDLKIDILFHPIKGIKIIQLK